MPRWSATTDPRSSSRWAPTRGGWASSTSSPAPWSAPPITPTSRCPMAAAEAFWLGSVPYAAAWDLQRALVEEVRDQRRPDTLLPLEHPHVFTLGRQGQ